MKWTICMAKKLKIITLHFFNLFTKLHNQISNLYNFIFLCIYIYTYIIIYTYIKSHIHELFINLRLCFNLFNIWVLSFNLDWNLVCLQNKQFFYPNGWIQTGQTHPRSFTFLISICQIVVSVNHFAITKVVINGMFLEKLKL